MPHYFNEHPEALALRARDERACEVTNLLARHRKSEQALSQWRGESNLHSDVAAYRRAANPQSLTVPQSDITDAINDATAFDTFKKRIEEFERQAQRTTTSPDPKPRIRGTAA